MQHTTYTRGGEFKMKTILAAMFADMIGVTFVGSPFAGDGKKMDAPAAAPSATDATKKTETKAETPSQNKNGKKQTQHKKTSATKQTSTPKTRILSEPH